MFDTYFATHMNIHKSEHRDQAHHTPMNEDDNVRHLAANAIDEIIYIQTKKVQKHK